MRSGEAKQRRRWRGGEWEHEREREREEERARDRLVGEDDPDVLAHPLSLSRAGESAMASSCKGEKASRRGCGMARVLAWVAWHV